MTDWTTLIAPGELAVHLDDDDVRIVDCRFDLADVDYGRRAFRESRLPGAVYADIERDLSGVVSKTTGRHPLPAPDDFIAWLGANGVARETRVACYDDASGAFAARLWWLLRHWLGHPAVAVLDGCFARWRAERYPLEEGEPSIPLAADYPRINPASVTVDANALARAGGGLEVIDARAAARFRGETEPVDPVSGHVPGALNRPFTDNLDAEGRWRAPEDLRSEWQALLGDRAGESAVHMCGSGVTACHNLLAMEYAGLPGGRLYAGSWSEWIRDPARPVERGPPVAG